MNGRVFQRAAGTTSGPISLAGTYTGSAPNVEAQVLLASNSSVITAWAPLTGLVQSGGNWSGKISAPQGGAYKVQVRSALNHSLSANGSNSCFVGAWVLMYGQSNMEAMSSVGQGTPPAANTGTGYFDGANFVAVPNAFGVREFLNQLNTKLGIPVAAFNPSVGGTQIGFLVNGNWATVTAEITAMGGDFEAVIWDQGEGEAQGVPTQETAYLALLQQLVTQCQSATGRSGTQLNMFVSSLATIASPSVPSDWPWWAQQQTTLGDINTAGLANIFYSHSDTDAIPGSTDGLHYPSAAYTRAGDRFAQSVATFYGSASGYANWWIASAAVVNATTTTVVVTQNLGTDFTPTSGISGFEVSGTDGATWIAATGARTDATHISLTHASLGTGTRLVRYVWGQNPDISANVFDNSSLTLPLNYTPKPIICTTGSPTPAPTHQLNEPSVFNGGSTIATVSNQPIGAATSDRLVILSLANLGLTPTGVVITPNAGSPVSATLVVAVAGGGGSIWQAIVPTGTVCSIAVTFASNPFSGCLVDVWTVPSAQMSSTTAVGTANVKVVQPSNTPPTVNATLATTSGGFVIAGCFESDFELVVTIGGDELYANDHFTPTGQTQAAHAAPVSTAAASNVNVTFSGVATGGHTDCTLWAASWR